ncbi:hypothetical protein BRD56_01170 [Thermoplasmatales archaeon SW_10_69_26]|nr:MAG: hypothetical protein BRD56_01170 [Thermoplasmatales archaeon SW_10_69_26]
MRWRSGLAVWVGLAMALLGMAPVAADDGAGETFVEMEIGDAPAPTVGYTTETDGGFPADRGRTVDTFEVPDRFDEFHLYMTEKHTEATTRAEVWESFTAEAPSGASVQVGGHTGGTGFGFSTCLPPAVSCTYEKHPGSNPNYVKPAEDGTYELRVEGVVTGTYTVTGYGLSG